MPEIKHTFHAGKMNKDLDERLIKNGEYRHAMNVQVRTTDDPDGDGGESGAIQNIKGNSLIGESYFADWHTQGGDTNPQTSRCVGSVADEKKDKAYFFFASALHPPNWAVDDQRRVYVDSIVEQGLNNHSVPVVVDVFGVVDRLNNVLAEDNDFSSSWSTIKTLDGSIYKPGMEIRVVDEFGTSILHKSPLKIRAIDNDTILLHEECTVDITTSGKWFIFESERVLNFSPGNFLIDPLDNNNLTGVKNYITGINVIDGMIFWTDNYSEPKKINIDRCKAGTNINGVNNNFLRPTKLYVKDPISGQFVDANTTDFELDYGGSTLSNGSGINSYLKEEHITVIRKSPPTAPTLVMNAGRGDSSEILLTSYTFEPIADGVISTGDSFSINDPAVYNTNFRKNDILEFSNLSDVEVKVTASFISYQNIQGEDLVNTLSTTSIMKINIISAENVTNTHTSWVVRLKPRQKPLFETKFGRFGYRYKYSDGEYSAFSPWSEIAFLPGRFSYKTDDGYNLGMVNNLRELTIKDFIPYKKPLDVVAIDILYKSTDSANVFVVDTVEKGKSSEWNKFTPDGTGYTNKILTGSLEITSEMIHRALPSDQILRSWDNVPRFAKAQEIIASRLVYGNYTQGYNINNVNVNLSQDIVSKNIDPLTPAKSVKSMRDYKVGMVFGDKYGRETPVITSGYTTIDITDEGHTSMTGDVSVPKSLSASQNSFIVTQSWGDPNYEAIPPTIKDGGWIDYVKYYIKETSNEYHNLVMDRWYQSGDVRSDGGYNNIWLSFNSADRNKVDEDTYLTLKNTNGSDSPVFENARYKIIAIENEAPEYIKTRRNSIGVIGDLNTDNTFLTIFPSTAPGDGTGGTANASNTQPSQLWTKSSIEIHGATWNASGMGNTLSQSGLFGRDIKGKLEARIIGVNITDGVQTGRHELPWKEVVHYTTGEGDGELDGGSNIVKLRWDSPWLEEEADIYTMVSELQQLGTEGYTLATLQYWLEIRESIVENKPEFDGKFFVKIKQDHFTDRNIEIDAVPLTNQTIAWEQQDLGALYYIRSTYQSGASGTYNSGMFAQEGFYEFDWNLDQPPYVNGTTQEPQPYFFGAFDEFLRPGPIGPGLSYWFDKAGESVDGPEGYFAASRTDFGDEADGYVFDGDDYSPDGEICNCVYHHEHGTTSAWSPEGSISGQGAWSIKFSQGMHLIKDLSPFGACSNNYSRMTRDFWISFKNQNMTDDGDVEPLYSPLFIDECEMAEMFILPGPDRELLGRLTSYENNASDIPTGYLSHRGGPDHLYGIVGDYRDGFENGSYARPRKGLGPGQGIVNGVIGATDDTYGTMVLSFVNSHDDIYSTNPEEINPIWTAMQNPGQIFTLDSDIQNGTKYQVMGCMYKSYSFGGVYGSAKAQKNYSGDVVASGGAAGNIHHEAYTMNSASESYMTLFGGHWFNKCDYFPTNGTANKKCRFRHTAWIEFRRLNDNYQVTTLGMDQNDDPRKLMRHDGTQSGAVIRLLSPGSYSDTGADMDALAMELNNLGNTNGAVFETDPKKDSDLDLYYEASDALPMVLNENNVFNYVPINSKVSALRTQNSNENEWPLSDRRDNHKINNAHFTHDYTEHAILSIVSDDIGHTEVEDGDGNIIFTPSETYGQSILHRRDFTIGDTLLFKHGNGATTRAKIEQMYKPVIPKDSDEDGVSDNFNTITSSDIKHGVISGPKAFTHAGTVTNTVTFNNSGYSFSVLKTTIAGNGGNLEIGDVVKAIDYPNSSGGISSVTFGQHDQQAPRGIQIIGFDSTSETVSAVTLSGLPTGYAWNNILSDRDTSSSTTNMTFVFQKNYGYYGININVYKQPVQLGWHNCYAFGNGLESDRIRDDFNAPTIDNGVKVSTTFSGYKREKIKSGLIYSGLYNSKSQVNELNQFNMGEKITKDLNPSYGSIQALKTRDTDLVVFAEDKVLKVLASKDALYNADGNPQLTSTDRVLGTAVPYAGDFGISKDPQSLAWDQYRMYFADRQRGAVLRLSQDGLTPISDIGMKTWFRDQLTKSNSIQGSFDVVSGEYNITITPPGYISLKSKTLSFDETAKGWVSFKSFTPDSGVSYSGNYVTAKNHQIWKHHVDKSLSGQVVDRNSFYGNDTINSSVEVIFNDQPSLVKSFKTMNYEGSQARVEKYTGSIESVYTGSVNWSESNGVLYPSSPIVEDLSVTDNEYYNLVSKNGWWVPGMYTDIQHGEVQEFKDKEGKWFSKISGVRSNTNNLDTDEFTVQGVGVTDAYVYTGPVVNECFSGCLDSNYQCVDCTDSSLNDQCTNGANEVVNCNSPFCVAGPCITSAMAVYGCINPGAINYNEDANVDDGSCEYSVIGCMEPENPNYNPYASISDPMMCTDGVVTGCMDPNALNFDPTATQDGVFVDHYDSYLEQTLSLFSICYNDCSCLYDITPETPAECDCVTVVCPECCNESQTWNPSLEWCVDNDWSDICADSNGYIVSCGSVSCASGPCSGGGSGELNCIDGGPDCCGPSQAWSWYSLSCEDIVYGCMDTSAINYIGPHLQYQWPNQSSTGHDNINGITYNGLLPGTDNPHPAYNPANLMCYELQYVGSPPVLTQVYGTCCEYAAPVLISGCTDPLACNHMIGADVSCSDCCNYDCVGCMDPLSESYNSNFSIPCDDCCSEYCTGEECFGCRDQFACNYNPDAWYSDGSCWYAENCNTEESECDCENEPSTGNNPYPCYGCTNLVHPETGLPSLNYCPCCHTNAYSPNEIDAGVDQCEYAQSMPGCKTQGMFNYCANCTEDDGSCYPIIEGCMDENAFNFDPNLFTGDVQTDINTPCASCCEDKKWGCMDSTMANYNPSANTFSDSCVPFVYGCMDPVASNYAGPGNTLGDSGGEQYPIATHDEYHTWGGDENWDGTPEGQTNNWIRTYCSECECTYTDPIGDMVIANDTTDSAAVIDSSTNPWLLDPETTDSQESLFENGPL